MFALLALAGDFGCSGGPTLVGFVTGLALDDLKKGLYENFTLGRLPERQFNRLMTEYDTEQSSLEQRISELETATERISTKAVQIDKLPRF